ncbi:MAG: hypothetical protein ABTQ32_30320 [Myxococcaceae bacterium]
MTGGASPSAAPAVSPVGGEVKKLRSRPTHHRRGISTTEVGGGAHAFEDEAAIPP